MTDFKIIELTRGEGIIFPATFIHCGLPNLTKQVAVAWYASATRAKFKSLEKTPSYPCNAFATGDQNFRSFGDYFPAKLTADTIDHIVPVIHRHWDDVAFQDKD